MSKALEAAVELARQEEQLVLWDRQTGLAGIAIWSDEAKGLVPLGIEEARLLLAADPELERQWRKWNAMMGGRGRLVIVEQERCRRLLLAICSAGSTP